MNRFDRDRILRSLLEWLNLHAAHQQLLGRGRERIQEIAQDAGLPGKLNENCLSFNLTGDPPVEPEIELKKILSPGRRAVCPMPVEGFATNGEQLARLRRK